MSPIISLFNHKGGVSKTTTAFNLGWALAGRGKQVLIVDADPQCNLTGTVLGFDGISDFADFYTLFTS
jgi:chromosome partitioning protein